MIRQPLIDADIFLYEVGFAAEAGWQLPGFPSFDYVEELLVNRINEILLVTEATLPPKLYLTGKGNFRYDIAKRQPYKRRAGNRPWHYNNIKAYLNGTYDTTTSEGMEADDLMAIEQTRRPDETIICTRDKDLRQVPGWHYGWELGAQPAFGPMLVDSFGAIKFDPIKKKLTGWGDKFFYAQCLMGDAVDTIPGIPRLGPAKAFKLLEATTTSEEAFKATVGAYRAAYEDRGEEELLEQGRLVHMTRHLHEDGKPVLWSFPQ